MPILNTLMGEESMLQDKDKQPEIIVFAGPNGSGKSTITKLAKVIEPYINADDIKSTTLCNDLEAAVLAENLREENVESGNGFTFETVLSTDRNLKFLKKAKGKGFFIRCIYVLTSDVNINVARVESRKETGGHGVPEDKIRSRYTKALHLLPELINVCDIVHVYDNTDVPYRIFKKRKKLYFYWENEYWDKLEIENLTGIKFD